MYGRLTMSERNGVVTAIGELDTATCEVAVRTLSSVRADVVVLDMTELAFLDCAGYGALVESRGSLARRGRSLQLRHAHGEPAHLLRLVAEMEDRSGRTVHGVSACPGAPRGAGTTFNTESTRLVTELGAVLHVRSRRPEGSSPAS